MGANNKPALGAVPEADEAKVSKVDDTDEVYELVRNYVPGYLQADEDIRKEFLPKMETWWDGRLKKAIHLALIGDTGVGTWTRGAYSSRAVVRCWLPRLLLRPLPRACSAAPHPPSADHVSHTCAHTWYIVAARKIQAVELNHRASEAVWAAQGDSNRIVPDRTRQRGHVSVHPGDGCVPVRAHPPLRCDGVEHRRAGCRRCTKPS